MAFRIGAFQEVFFMSSNSEQTHAVSKTTGDRIIVEGTQDSLANPEYAEEPFVEFEKVNPETELESLNLNWRERDLPERQRTKHVHRLHPYLGKFIPQLVEIFLRKFQPRLVCDPFGGSGTTLVEAATLGIDSFGVDVSPFNCLLTKVKTDTYNLEKLARQVYDILHRSDKNERSLFALHSSDSPCPPAPTEYISNWFAPQAQRELLSYCALIPEYEYADVMKVILSRSARSARLVPHHQLDFPKEPQRGPYKCRKHGRICTPVKEARKFLKRYSEDTVRRITEFARIRRQAETTVTCQDSRHTDFPPANLLITSPPYVGLIDYHEQHTYAYELLSLLPDPFARVGYVNQELRRNEEVEIGSATEGRSKAAREQYVDGIGAVLGKAIDPMPRGSHIAIVVNDKDNLYSDIFARLPVEHVTTLNRHVNRRTGRRNAAFYEEVLIWRRS